MLFDLAANSVPRVHEGSIRALAVTSAKRLASVPDVPTVDEAGLRGFYFLNWHAIWAPHGTSAEITSRLNTAIKTLLADPRTLRRLADIGQQIPPIEQQTPQALVNYQHEEIARWWPIIRAANIKGQ